jgi:hypothetical protein
MCRSRNRSQYHLGGGRGGVVSKSVREKIKTIGKGVNKYKMSDNFVGKCHYGTQNLTKKMNRMSSCNL